MIKLIVGFSKVYLVVWKLLLVSIGSLLILIESSKYSPETTNVMSLFITIGLILWLVLQAKEFSKIKTYKINKKVIE